MPEQIVEQPQIPDPAVGVPAPPAPPTPGRVIVTRDGDKTITIDGAGVHVERTAPTAEIAPSPDIPTIPPQAVDISLAFFLMVAFICVFTPLARAYARRMDRRSVVPAAPDEGARLARIEAAVEAVAVEVERIGEGQRYVTQLMSRRDPAMARLGGGEGQ